VGVVGKKRKLRKKLQKRELADAPALVICTGKKCGPREQSCALVEELRAYAAATHPEVRIVTVGCLGVCEHGPIAATYPKIRFHERVDARCGRWLVCKVAHLGRGSDD
jgi:(2Fe-2S) ferredoxin